MEALEQLKSVLCDPEGNVCISGSDGDRKVISDALKALEQQVAALTKERDHYLRELQAAQARFKELSAVLEGVEIPFNLHVNIRYLLRESA